MDFYGFGGYEHGYYAAPPSVAFAYGSFAPAQFASPALPAASLEAAPQPLEAQPEAQPYDAVSPVAADTKALGSGDVAMSALAVALSPAQPLDWVESLADDAEAQVAVDSGDAYAMRRLHARQRAELLARLGADLTALEDFYRQAQMHADALAPFTQHDPFGWQDERMCELRRIKLLAAQRAALTARGQLSSAAVDAHEQTLAHALVASDRRLGRLLADEAARYAVRCGCTRALGRHGARVARLLARQRGEARACATASRSRMASTAQGAEAAAHALVQRVRDGQMRERRAVESRHELGRQQLLLDGEDGALGPSALAEALAAADEALRRDLAALDAAHVAGVEQMLAGQADGEVLLGGEAPAVIHEAEKGTGNEITDALLGAELEAYYGHEAESDLLALGPRAMPDLLVHIAATGEADEGGVADLAELERLCQAGGFDATVDLMHEFDS